MTSLELFHLAALQSRVETSLSEVYRDAAGILDRLAAAADAGELEGLVTARQCNGLALEFREIATAHEAVSESLECKVDNIIEKRRA